MKSIWAVSCWIFFMIVMEKHCLTRVEITNSQHHFAVLRATGRTSHIYFYSATAECWNVQHEALWSSDGDCTQTSSHCQGWDLQLWTWNWSKITFLLVHNVHALTSIIHVCCRFQSLQDLTPEAVEKNSLEMGMQKSSLKLKPSFQTLNTCEQTTKTLWSMLKIPRS